MTALTDSEVFRMTGEPAAAPMVLVAELDDLRERGVRVVAAEGRTIAVFAHAGKVFAVDNRCPHMGFPLSRGTVSDGILTCHWHHAKFDLAGGCTFDPFADDVASFRTEVRNNQVWVDPRPAEEDRRGHWLQKLEEGLEQNLRLVIAKAVVGLADAGATGEIVERTTLFATSNRAAGWGDGLSILTAMVNVQPALAEGDRARALYKGVLNVARNVAGQAPDFDLEPLRTDERRPEVYRSWFRRFVETRSAAAAERCLRTAIVVGLSHQQLADMLFAACTDHLFMDTGHALDFANKACELLDHLGWDKAANVLPSLIPGLAAAERMEETSAWQHPVHLPSLIRDADQALGAALLLGKERLDGWDGHRAIAETILDEEPKTSLAAIVAAVRDGVPLIDLSAAVAYAAARRPVHFHVSNEFDDWNTVHHTFTYTNAVDQAMRRAPSRELARGILDGAMSVYLERFLNVPKQAMPTPGNTARTADDLLAEFDRQQRVDETAQVVVDLLAGGQHQLVIETLGHALLREDAGFHQFQIYEAALRQYGNFRGRPEGDHILVGAARFLTAHAPTVRAAGQTFDIAERLHRGEALDGESPT
jgi:nitrite reductase/ring-hydroxylating ferredoxin subunit